MSPGLVVVLTLLTGAVPAPVERCRPCPPGDGGCVRGSVYDSTGAPLPGVAVRLIDAGVVTVGAGTEPLAARSDADGRFVVADVPPGLVRIELELPGFAVGVSQPFQVGEGETRDLSWVSLSVLQAGMERQILDEEPTLCFPEARVAAAFPGGESLIYLRPETDLLVWLDLSRWEELARYFAPQEQARLGEKLGALGLAPSSFRFGVVGLELRRALEGDVGGGMALVGEFDPTRLPGALEKRRVLSDVYGRDLWIVDSDLAIAPIPPVLLLGQPDAVEAMIESAYAPPEPALERLTRVLAASQPVESAVWIAADLRAMPGRDRGTPWDAELVTASVDPVENGARARILATYLDPAAAQEAAAWVRSEAAREAAEWARAEAAGEAADRYALEVTVQGRDVRVSLVLPRPGQPQAPPRQR